MTEITRIGQHSSEEGFFLDKGKNSPLVDFGIVVIGERRRSDLVKEMKSNGVECNQQTRKFVFRNKENTPVEINLVEFQVKDLMGKGASLKDVVDKAKLLGLDLCPREVAAVVALEKGSTLDGPIGVLSRKGGGMGFVSVDYFNGQTELKYLEKFKPDTILDPTEKIVMIRGKRVVLGSAFADKNDFEKFAELNTRVALNSAFAGREAFEAFKKSD